MGSIWRLVRPLRHPVRPLRHPVRHPCRYRPSTIEPIVPIVAQLGAQDTPSVIQRAQDTTSVNQGARPAISTEQTMQSTQRYGTLPYVSGLPYTANLPSTAPLPYAAMPSMLARPSYPMGYYGQGNQFPLMPNPNWMSVREQMLQHQLLQERQQFEAWRASQAQPQPHISSSWLPIKVGDNVEIISGRSASAKRPRPKDQAAVKALKCATSASTSRRSLSPRRDYPRGTCTATRPSQASPKRAQDIPAPAQDLEAFKGDITCCQTCFNPPLIGTIRSEIRLDSVISPGLACESGSLSSPGASRSWSRSRPTSCGSA